MRMNKLIALHLTLALFVLMALFSFEAKAIDEPVLKKELETALGNKSSWKIAFFSKLSAGMSCDDVKKVFPTLTGCDPAKDYSFPKAKVSDNSIIFEVKFTFKSGQLKGGELKFKSSIDSDLFKKVSAEVFQAKWGNVKPEKKDKNILTRIGPKFAIAQRSLLLKVWGIKADFPTTE